MTLTACMCSRCGDWIGEVSNEFLKVYKKKGSVPEVDYKLEFDYCDKCQRQDRLNDEKNFYYKEILNL